MHAHPHACTHTHTHTVQYRTLSIHSLYLLFIVGKEVVLQLQPDCKLAVPLGLAASLIWVKPTGWSVDYCNNAIQWQNVQKPGQFRNTVTGCDTLFGGKNTYR